LGWRDSLLQKAKRPSRYPYVSVYTVGVNPDEQAADATPNLDICRNISDWGYRGFHFVRMCNREEFRENSIGRHTRGLQLDPDAEIGKQERTLNKWPYAGAPVGIWSALNQNPDFQSSDSLPIPPP